MLSRLIRVVQQVIVRQVAVNRVCLSIRLDYRQRKAGRPLVNPAERKTRYGSRL